MYLIISAFHMKTDIDNSLKQSKHLDLFVEYLSLTEPQDFLLSIMHVSDRCFWEFWEIISINCCSPCLNADVTRMKYCFVNHHKYMIAAHRREAHLIIHICNINISVHSKSYLSKCNSLNC